MAKWEYLEVCLRKEVMPDAVQNHMGEYPSASYRWYVYENSTKTIASKNTAKLWGTNVHSCPNYFGRKDWKLVKMSKGMFFLNVKRSNSNMGCRAYRFICQAVVARPHIRIELLCRH